MSPAPGIGDRLAGDELIDDPYPFFARLRRETPVWHLSGTDVYLVSTWGLVADAVARVEDFSNHFRHALFSRDDGSIGVLNFGERGAPDVFAGADPPGHTAHRRLFFPELVQHRMELLEDYVAELADELLDELLANSGGDVTSCLANPLPLRVMAERVIGFRGAAVDELQRWVFAGSRYMGGRLRLHEMAQVAGEAAPMLPWITAQMDDALLAPHSGDVLGAAAAGVQEGVLTRDEAAFTLTVLLGAGAETTTSLIGNAVRVLAERAELQEELRADRGLVPAFVEEVLRFESPFRFHPRTASHAVILGDVEIPEGSMVLLLWSAANRDLAVFDRPDEVMLRRPNERLHLGFGRGIHHCVGAPLARLRIACRAHKAARPHHRVRPRPRPATPLGRQLVDPAPRAPPCGGLGARPFPSPAGAASCPSSPRTARRLCAPPVAAMSGLSRVWRVTRRLRPGRLNAKSTRANGGQAPRLGREPDANCAAVASRFRRVRSSGPRALEINMADPAMTAGLRVVRRG